MDLCGLVGYGEFTGEDFLVTFRTEGMFSREIPVNRADREGRRDGDVGEAESGEDPSYQLATGLRTGDPFVHVEMENRSPGVAPLQLLLMDKGLEGIIRLPYGKL